MISLRYALHPHLPARLGFSKLLAVTHPELGRLLRTTRPYSNTPDRARVTIYRVAEKVLKADVPGDFTVLGTHRGGTAAPLARLLRCEPERQLHLFDRWGDLPDPTADDGFRAEQYRKDRIPEKLRELVERPPLLDARHLIHDIAGLPGDRAHYYEGWFEETLSEDGPYLGRPIAFALLHCDYYESVKRALAFVARHAAPGAVAFVNDYGSWPGSTKATDEFLAANGGRVSTSFTNFGQPLLRFA